MSARKTSELPTRNWKFAARLTSPEDPARDILWRCSRYYNALVAVEQERQERFAAVRRAHCPALAALEDQWSAADDAVRALYAEARSQRADWYREHAGDKARLLPPEFEGRRAALDAQKRSVSERAKPLRAAFNDLFAPARATFKRRVDDAAQGRGPRTRQKVNAAVLAEMLAEPEWHPVWKAVAQSDDLAHEQALEARAGAGLYAGTYLGVEEAFVRAKKDLAPQAPRFKRFQHSGAVRVQVTGGLTWGAIVAAAGVRSGRLAIERLPPRSRSPRSNIFAVALDQSCEPGAPPCVVRVVAKLHRLPPDDALVKWVSVVLRPRPRRTGPPALDALLLLTVEHASFDAPKRPAGARAAEHVQLGWARAGSGLRVAHWPGGEVVCPTRILDRAGFADSQRSVADRLRDEAVRRFRLVTHLAGHRIAHAAWQRLGHREVARLREVAEGYARHVLGAACEERWRAWVRDRRAARQNLYAPILELRRTMGSRGALAWWCWLWARKHAHIEQVAANVRRKAVHARDQHYRLEAIRLATEFESLTVDDYSVADLKALEPLTMPGTGVRDQAQWQLQHAAPGRFREILLEVMGPRCAPRERPGAAPEAGGARKGSSRGKPKPKAVEPAPDP